MALSTRGEWAHSGLAWCRDSKNDWRSELKEGIPPETIRDVTIDLSPCNGGGLSPSADVYDPWRDKWSSVSIEGGTLRLPEFRRSLVVKVKRRGD